MDRTRQNLRASSNSNGSVVSSGGNRAKSALIQGDKPINWWLDNLSHLIGNLPIAAMLTDLKGDIEIANEQLLAFVGLPQDRVVGQPFPYPWLSAGDYEEVTAWLNEAQEKGNDHQLHEGKLLDSQGNCRYAQVAITPLRNERGRLAWLLITYRDTNQNTSATTAAAPFPNQEQSQWQQMLDGIPIWLQICQLDGTIELSNQAASSISGYSRAEMVGQAWPYPWFPDAPAKTPPLPYVELYQANILSGFETSCATKGGFIKSLNVNLSLLREENGEPSRVLLMARDLTNDKRLEAELIQAHKIQAVSQLASVVAHDINNNLAVILGYSELLSAKAKNLNESMQKALIAIQEQAMECANTVKRIQLFARPIPPSQFTPTQVNEVVEEVIKITQPIWQDQAKRAGANIKVETDLGDLPAVQAYRSGIKETLLNLIKNSVEALPNGGVIRISACLRGQEVELKVQDNGVGIDPRHLGRIFDPFFTTKGPASSGLGLSIAYNLITQQGGSITAATREGEGATFTIRLPAALEVETNSSSPLKQTTTSKRYLNVLVVDDEPLVGQVIEAMLESSGHQVTTCICGTQALEVFQDAPFDVAVVDLSMPEIDGWEVTRRINHLRPEFPVIMATGWNVSVETGQGQGAEVRAVLRKPFGVTDLNRALEQAIP